MNAWVEFLLALLLLGGWVLFAFVGVTFSVVALVRFIRNKT